MPCIVRYLQQYPDVDVSAYFLDRVVNMVEEGMDVAVRIGPLPDSGLKALRVGRVRRMLCASPTIWRGMACRSIPPTWPGIR